MGVAWLLFWVVVIIVVIRLVKRGSAHPGQSSSAVSLLEERYARGELTREEFLERRAVLRGDTPP